MGPHCLISLVKPKDVLQEFCGKRQGLYLDFFGERPGVRTGKKLKWEDEDKNSHELDFVIEKDGSRTEQGQPVAFIEVAWRRYTKHSRNKAQEIQGAVLPLAAKYRWDKPFLGVVLAGGRVRLNTAKVAEAARWDGLRGITAWGCDDADPRDLVIQYRRLREIEACFRANRHDPGIRPVFHWKPRRVKAHIAVRYMAFRCLQHLRRRLGARGHPMSPDRIGRALAELRFSILGRSGGPGRFGVPHRAAPDAEEIYRTLGLKWTRRPFVIEPPDAPGADREETTARSG